MRKINEMLAVVILSLLAVLVAAVGLRAYDTYVVNRQTEADLKRQERILARNREAYNRVLEMRYEIEELSQDRERLGQFLKEIQTGAVEAVPVLAMSGWEEGVASGGMTENAVWTEYESLSWNDTVSEDDMKSETQSLPEDDMALERISPWEDDTVSENASLPGNGTDSGNISLSDNRTESENTSLSENDTGSEKSLSGNDTDSGDISLLGNDTDLRDTSLSGNDMDSGDTSLSGNDMDSGETSLSGNDTDLRDTSLSGNDTDLRDTSLSGNGTDSRETSLSGNSTVSENTSLSGNSTVSENTSLSDNSAVSENTSVSENDTVSGNTGLPDNTSGDMQSLLPKLVTPEVTLEERRSQRTSWEETLLANQEDLIRLAERRTDFSDKKIACLGDSITAAANLEKEEGYLSYSYPAVLKELLEAQEVYNLGIGGSSIGRYWADAFVDRYTQIPEDADIIIVMGGTNDGFCLSEEEFGTLAERKPWTFCGDLDELMRGLKENYPDAEILFATPLPNIVQDYLMRERPYLLPQENLVNVILTLAAEYDFEVIDLYNSNILDPHDADILADYMPDGVHCNQEGYRILAEHMAAELLRSYE